MEFVRKPRLTCAIHNDWMASVRLLQSLLRCFLFPLILSSAQLSFTPGYPSEAARQQAINMAQGEAEALFATASATARSLDVVSEALT